MRYFRLCKKCGCYNDIRKIIDGKEYCNNCDKELPKEEKKQIFTMKDSSGIVR